MRENSEEVVRERESQCKLRELRELERRESLREHREHRELERTETLWVTVFFFFLTLKCLVIFLI